MSVRVLAIGVVGLLCGGCGAAAFACQTDAQCDAAGAVGTCQPDGWCSFPDGDCESGERYGGHAGDGLAGHCVPNGATSSEASGSSNASSIATTLLDDSSASVSITSADTTTTTTTSATTISTTMTTTSSPTDASAEGAAMCGDGVQQAGEECDDGRLNDDAGNCTKACTLAVCGDGHVHAPFEACDVTDFGGSDCSTYGFPNGELDCSADCQTISADGCDGCGGGLVCPAFGACHDAVDCGKGANCISIGSDVGTCLPPCDGMCPQGQFCTISFSTCALPCGSDADCPGGMRCGQLPSDDQGACLW